MDLSRTDPLTGLRNIRAFEERLADEVVRAQRYHTPLSLLMADVDRLKAINDGGGHHAGSFGFRRSFELHPEHQDHHRDSCLAE